MAYSDFLRRIYRGGRPNTVAKVMNKASALAFGAGVAPDRLATLVVPGRRSGRDIAFPVVVLTDDPSHRYLVAMLGEKTNWVLNAAANGGRAVLRHGRTEAITLEPVPVTERAPIIKRYLAIAPGARPHIPVDRHAPVSDFATIAGEYPVFRIAP